MVFKKLKQNLAENSHLQPIPVTCLAQVHHNVFIMLPFRCDTFAVRVSFHSSTEQMANFAPCMTESTSRDAENIKHDR